MDKRNWKDLGILFVAILLIAASIGMALTRNISDESDDVVTFIQNSNGNYWTATEANFQLAIDDAGDYGWVEIPKCNISVTSRIWTNYTGLEIYGHGNASKLYLADSANETVIRSDESNHCYFHDFMIDANGLNQPVSTGWLVGDYHDSMVCGMQFDYCYNTVFENLYITDTRDAGIHIYDGGYNVTFRGIQMDTIGKVWEGEADGMSIFFPSGIYCRHVDNLLVTGCKMNDVHGDCIVSESGSSGYYVSNTIVSDCQLNNAFNGVWFEYTKDSSVSNVFATNMQKTEAYEDPIDAGTYPCGFLNSHSFNVTYSGCHAINCGEVGETTHGYGFLTGNSGEGTTIDNCHTYGTLGAGICISTDHCVVSNSHCKDDYYGMRIIGQHTKVSGNDVRGSTSHGIVLDYARYSIVSGNTIHTTDSAGSDGISFLTWTIAAPTNITISSNHIYDPYDDGISYDTVNGGSPDNCVISHNHIYDADVGIRTSTGSNNKISYNEFDDVTTEIIASSTDIRTLNDGDDYDYYRDDLIWNSNGHYYPATEAGLQDAINDLNNESGWVDGNMNNVSISNTIYLGTNCELHHIKLFLSASADVTMIMNYDISNGNDNICIHDVILEGNGGQQTPEVATFLMYNNPAGIYLIHCDWVNLHDIRINNTQFGGVFVQQGKHATLRNIDVTKPGQWLYGASEAGDHYTALGIYLYNTTNSTIDQCTVVDFWSAGIVIESTFPSVNPHRCYQTTVSDCICNNGTIGFYCEDAENVTFIGCWASNLSVKEDAYSASVGYNSKRDTTRNLKYLGCGCSDISYYGFLLGADDSLIQGCTIMNCQRGIHMSWANDSIITNNWIKDVSTYGITVASSSYKCYNCTISNNHLSDWGGSSIGINIHYIYDSLVMENQLKDNANIGIGGSNSDNGNIVIFNKFESVTIELWQVGDRINCTGFDDWNFYDGVS